MSYEISDSILVPASPGRVYDVVSDVTRTGEWSPQCYRCEWNSDERGVGATFTGYNRTPEREWQTVSTVVNAEPGAEFAWSVGKGRAVWGFRIDDAGNGQSTLTEYTIVGPTVEEFFAERFGDDAAAELEQRRLSAEDGIPRTLESIRAILAADPA